jgi:Sulfatase
MSNRLILIWSILLTVVGLFISADFAQAAAKQNHPNIIAIVTDDTGIDQYSIFGYGGNTDEQAKTPNIDAIARAGVRFRNTWSHPSCGPTRSSILNGRYTIRTNVLSAPTLPDLPNSQSSPFEYMIPTILKQRNYVSAAIGKMHLSTDIRDKANLPFLNETYRELGFDYFEGYLEGGPAPIDTTAGGIAASGTYGCGFVPSLKDNPSKGADTGACYQAQGSCELISTATVTTPGRACLEKGGIFVPNTSCGALPSNLKFSTQNGHYTGNWVINREDGKTTETQPPSDARARGFKTQQEVTRAVAWINRQTGEKPWMLSLGLAAIHEPVQQSPKSLVSAGAPATDGYDCIDQTQKRQLATQMVEAIDHEVGRLLVEAKLATYNSDGTLNYQPEKTNTYVIFTSDNGTWTTSVRSPFDPERAKGTAYQTGVWVPLIIAGPDVKKPGREVNHLVNLTDLYTFFGEVANIDVRKAVPNTRQLDSEKIMPYLLNPNKAAIRTTNYTVQGNNIRSSNSVSYPCLIPALNQCTYSLPSKSACLDQTGKWYGPEGEVTASPGYYTSCCQVNQATGVNYLSSITSTGIRNKNYKLVQQVGENCVNGARVQPDLVFDELYQINQDAKDPKLDRADAILPLDTLTKEQKRQYQTLAKKLKRIENSVVECPGDGNMDKVVNQKDLDDWAKFASKTEGLRTENGGGMGSWYDFGGPTDSTRPDGLTDETDKKIIEANLGKRCK